MLRGSTAAKNTILFRLKFFQSPLQMASMSTTKNSPYLKTRAKYDKSFNKKMDAKFTELGEKKRRKKVKKTESNPNTDSLEFFQHNVYPLTVKNEKNARLYKKHLDVKKFTFEENDIVQVVRGDCTGQRGVVMQTFRERGLVVVNGVNMFIPKIVAMLEPLKKTGIHTVEGPLEYKTIKHVGYQVIKIDLAGRIKENQLESLTEWVKKQLNGCIFCTTTEVFKHTRPDCNDSLIVCHHVENKNCVDKHVESTSLSRFKEFEDGFISLGKEKTDWFKESEDLKILKISSLIEKDDLLDISNILAPEKTLPNGETVISMVDDSFGKKGTVVSSFLDEVIVRLDGETKELEPLKFHLFAKYKNGKIDKNTLNGTQEVRMIKMGKGWGTQRFAHLPMIKREAIRPVTKGLFDMGENDINDNLCTPTDIVDEVTYKPPTNI